MIPLATFGILVSSIVKENVVNQKMERIKTQNNVLKNYIVSENYMETQESDIVDIELSQLSNVYNGRIEIINSDYVIIKDTYVTDEEKVCIASSVTKAFRGETVSLYNSDDNYMEFAIPIMKSVTDEENGKEEETVAGVVLVVCQVEDIAQVMSAIGTGSIIFFAVVLLIVIGLATFVSIHLTKPYTELEQAMRGAANRDFDRKITIKSNNQVMKVTEAYNDMLDNMKKLDESRQEFVSNVSHELKTPITSIKVLADSLLSQENIPEELYREFLTDIAAEIDRENKIITDLLSMVKMDKSHAEFNLSNLNINDVIEICLKRLRPIAAEKNIELVFESFRPVNADVDEVKFSMAVSNLVENAIKYNVVDGWVRVTLNADHQFFYVTVADSGIGIPAEDQEQIFERFFRVDKARTRETGGTGLGLAITKNIILMHNGEIKVHSKEDEGTTFTVRIPLNHINETREEQS